MGNFHTRRRVLSCLFLATAVVRLGGCSCSDRPVTEENANRAEAACMWLLGPPHVFLADGRSLVMYDEARQVNGTVCACLTDAELETEARHDELHDAALQECHRLVTQYDDVVGDDCDEQYESGQWLDHVYRPLGEVWSRGVPPGFACE